ncbi:MAG: hypothetical protein Q8N09_11895 [Thermodesulfovibrionia bacterium]|nr:hypothetical protein [Thermodesulfovibrionia bacterium]
MPDMKSFQKSLKDLYGSVNKNLTPEYIYGYLTRTAGYLFRNIVRNITREEDLIKPISWLVAFASKYDIDIQESFISRYPEACPYCIEKPCVCFKTDKQPLVHKYAHQKEKELSEKYLRILNSKTLITFDYATSIIATVYPNNEIIWRYAGPWYHFAKLQEEIAELHEAMSGVFKGEKDKRAIAGEITDVLAWLLGIWHIKFQTISFDEEFKSYYRTGCPVCKEEKVCTCQPYSSRSSGLVDFKILSKIKQGLEDLHTQIPKDYKKDVKELIESVSLAIEKQNQPLAEASVKEISTKLQTIPPAITGINSTLNIINNLRNLMEPLMRILGYS